MPSDTEARILEEIAKLHQRMTDSNLKDEEFREEVREKLDPMYSIFTNAKGFGDISVWILKALVLLGAGIGVVIASIKWLKN